MATITTGHNAPTGFTSGEVVTATKLNNHVNSATVTGIVNADIDANAAIAITKLANPQYTGFRNRIINGNFDIWQRGTSQTTNGYSSADRWRVDSVGSTFSSSRQAFAVGQSDVPSGPSYFYRIAVTSSAAAGNYCSLSQRIENIALLANQSVTVSFYAKADSAKPMAMELIQNFGTGGSPASQVAGIGAQKFNLTTAWQKFTATISVPSISGNLGTDNNNYFGIAFWLDAGSNFNSRTDTLGQQSGTFDIAQVQVEQGSVATPFEARPIGTELALCQRYFVSETWIALNGSVVVGLPVSMRATPTVTTTVGTAADPQNNRCFRLQHTSTSGTGITASAEL